MKDMLANLPQYQEHREKVSAACARPAVKLCLTPLCIVLRTPKYG
jgi:hypothetical protein